MLRSVSMTVNRALHALHFIQPRYKLARGELNKSKICVAINL